MRELRIGTVAFINALPLTRGLAGVEAAVPSRLARRFERGELDVALLPSVEARRQGAAIVPGIAIASRGPVDSVLLFHRRPLGEVDRVLLDESSRTSAALCRLLFARHLERDVAFAPCGPETDPRDCGDGAVLLIGDPAMTAPRDGLLVTDLATAWREWTGLPFVFAVWAARDEETAARAEPVLRSAKELGRREVAAIAREAAAASGLPPAALTTYLTERITFDLGPEERAGMERYLVELEAADLL